MSKDLEARIFRVQEFLSTHRGRDKVLRSVQFLARLYGGCLQLSGVSSVDGVLNVASSISSTRVVLRLLDDVGMIGFLIKSINGFRMQPSIYSLLDLLDTVVGLIFLPIEHLAFFGDQRLATFGTDRLHTTATVLWLMSLLINLSQLLMKIVTLKKDRCALTVPLVQCVSDVIIAVHYLPQGYLWSGQLPLAAVGFFGLLSSLLGLYRLIISFKESKSKEI